MTMPKKFLLYALTLLFIFIFYLLGNQANNVIISSAFFFEAKSFFALILSILVAGLYYKLSKKEKMQHKFYRQPGKFVGLHILMFIVFLILVYIFIQPSLQIWTKYTATKNYQNVFRYIVTDQTNTDPGLDLFHCDGLLINIDMHEDASFCLNTDDSSSIEYFSSDESSKFREIIDKQTSHRMRIKGSRTQYGVLVSSIELVEAELIEDGLPENDQSFNNKSK